VAEWYYIGHYGQLGPLTRDQIDELIEGGVIETETYVWRKGMANWLPAATIPELKANFHNVPPSLVSPPPTPTQAPAKTTFPQPGASVATWGAPSPAFFSLESDRSRVLGGLLQIFPGVGRMYLGYAGYGAMQLVLACFFIGWIWSIVDGLIILSGSVRYDGYGRRLKD
jgi:hypothetical protein